MFRIKICGITSVADALATARAGADAIGLNFFSRSPRYINRDQASEIVAALPNGIVKVGLFVNAPAVEIQLLARELSLDLIQLHGDESPQFLADLGGLPVMRAFRVGGDGLHPVLTYLEACNRLGCLPRRVLLDSCEVGKFGGTGRTADWQEVSRYRESGDLPELVLAGGLTADNVAEAIQSVGPAAVDTASGVESAPGRKDVDKIERFIREASRAFAAQ